MERLVLLLAQRPVDAISAPVPDLYLVNRGEAAEAAALVLARSLRLRGLHVELDAGTSTFGKQFKRADRSGAPWAVVLGEEELAAGEVQLKPLRDPNLTESSLSMADLDQLVALVRP
jgi:histidyl-tRNA synthetase